MNQNATHSHYWWQVGRWSLLVLFSFELVLRLFIVKSPQRVYENGWGVVPVAGAYSMQGSEGYGVLHYIDHGEVETPYQGGRSVVVLGDSTTLAAQVDPSLNYVSLTELNLRKRGFDADLHNLGRSARIMADHVYLAPAVNATFAPEVVVLQVSPDSFTLSYDPAAENYFIDDGGKLTLKHQEPPAVKSLGVQNTVSVSGLADFFGIRLWLVLDGLEKSHPGLFTNPMEGNLGNVTAVAPLSWENATEEQLRGLRLQVLAQVEAVREAYPDSVIVFLVIPSPPKISFEQRSVVWGNQADTQLVALLHSIEGVRVVYPLNVFEKFYQNQHVLPRGSFNSAFNYGHLNPIGHRAVAQALTAALKEILR